jgi:hypothetical protein
MAIRAYQVQSVCKPGKMLTSNKEGGGVYQERIQVQTAFLEDNLNSESEYGFCGLFTGYGITMKKWKNNLATYYRKKWQGSFFENWFEKHKLNEQLEPVALRDKVKDVCQLLLNGKGSYNLRDMCIKIGVVHRDYKEDAEKIGSSVSASFVRFNQNALFAGAIGDDCVSVFQGISGRGIGLPSESSYGVLRSIKNDAGCAGVGERNFDANKCAVEHIPLKPDAKYFVVLMNKAVRDVITDQEIAHMFRVESDKFEGLAERVSQFIVNKAYQTYELMHLRWKKKENCNVLTMPELAVKIIIINEPFNNFDDPAKKQKDKKEIEAVKIDRQKIDALLREYSQEVNDEHIDNLYKRIIDEHPEHRVERDKPTWWDRLHPYVMNKYTLGSIFATLIGYSFYTGYLKSFFSK